MVRVLHIARITTASTERRVACMTADPAFVFRLVRLAGTSSAELSAVRGAMPAERIVEVPAWRPMDPHRGLYGTATFGLRATPDIVHAEEEPDSLAALHVAAARRLVAPRARLVLFTWQNVNRPKRPVVRWVIRRTLAAADAVVCGNRAAVTVLRALGFAGPAPVIPAVSLDPGIFHRRRAARIANAFTVGYVGRLAPEKGVDVAIDAVAALGAPVVLAIAGDGPARPGLEARARAAGLGDRVRFLGALAPERVAEFLSSVDVLVVPSRSTPVWQEQYGRVIVEAMGCEVPVVGSDSGAIPEVIADAGLVVAEGRSDALADRLRELRDDEARRIDLGRRGLVHATTHHTCSLRAAQLLAFYRELLAAGGAA